MPNTLGPPYSTGTVSIANGASTAIFTGTFMTTQAQAGDFLFVNGNLLFYVNAVTDDTHLELPQPYGGAAIVNAPYMLLKMSFNRYDPAATQQALRTLLAYYEGAGVFYFVIGDTPDTGQGTDGQWALKVNSGPWKLWYHTGGAWILQGSPAGFIPKGGWISTTTYAQNDVVLWNDTMYASLISGNTGNQPDTSPADWILLMTHGDRYDIAFFDTDRPASGELVLKCEPTGVTFAAGLTTSGANAEVGATTSAVYSFRKNGVEFATLTFAAGGQGGAQNGTFTCATSTTFAAGDVFTMWAPPVRDATLSGVGGNIIGYR